MKPILVPPASRRAPRASALLQQSRGKHRRDRTQKCAQRMTRSGGRYQGRQTLRQQSPEVLSGCLYYPWPLRQHSCRLGGVFDEVLGVKRAGNYRSVSCRQVAHRQLEGKAIAPSPRISGKTSVFVGVVSSWILSHSWASSGLSKPKLTLGRFFDFRFGVNAPRFFNPENIYSFSSVRSAFLEQ